MMMMMCKTIAMFRVVLSMFSICFTDFRDSPLSSELSQPEVSPAMLVYSQSVPNVQDQWMGHSYPLYRKDYTGAHILKVDEPGPKRYYMLPLVGTYSVKISFDRLALLAVLDRLVLSLLTLDQSIFFFYFF